MIIKTGPCTPHPCMQLLHILERHGLTVEGLQAWVQFLEAEKTGSVTFHAVQGRLGRYEERMLMGLGAQELTPPG